MLRKLGRRFAIQNTLQKYGRRLLSSMDKPIPGLPTYLESDYPGLGKGHGAQTHISTLENGLRVASQEAFGQYSTVGVLVDAGSRYEVSYTSGISHLLNRLAFRSSSKFVDREAILTDLETYGGAPDCQRFRDVMMYSLSVFSFGVPQAINLLADTFWRPRLLKSEVEDTSEAIRFELEDMKTGPDVEPFLVELLHQASYRTNTLGLPCICPEESIGKFSEEDLKEFLASHYTPSRLVLAGVNVRHEQLVQLAREHFVAAPTSWDGVKPREVDGSMAQFTSGEVKFERLGPPVVGPNPLPDLTHVGLALESSSYLHDDFFVYAVMNSYMGGGGSFSAGGPGKGMYTHIYQNVLTQNHWIYWAMAQNHAYSDSGIFCILGSAPPSKVRKLIEVLCQQFLHMTKVPSEVALLRAKEMLKSALMMNLESRIITFEDIGRQVLGQDKKYTPQELCDRIDAVTARDMQRVGEKLMESNPSMAVIGDLKDVPARWEVETALHSNGGLLDKKSRILSKIFT